MAAVQSNAWLQQAAALFLAGPLDPAGVVKPTVRLVKAPFAPTVNLDPATLTEADFNGYAAKVVTAWGTPHLDSQNQEIFFSSGPLDWTPTGSGTPNTIYGYWLTDASTGLVQAEVFPTPVVLNGGATTLALVVGIAVRAGLQTSIVLP